MVDEEVLTDKLRYSIQYIGELKEMRGMDKREYVDDLVTQRAVERTLMNLIQVCIDLALDARAATYSPIPSASSVVTVDSS